MLASAVTQRSAYSTLEAPVREVGHALFEALFADRIYGRYTASLQEAGRKGEPLRVVLRLRVAELAGIPWETLFDPEAGEYLCQREPVVRYVDSAQPSAPLAATGPLRILGMVAAPRTWPRWTPPRNGAGSTMRWASCRSRGSSRWSGSRAAAGARCSSS